MGGSGGGALADGADTPVWLLTDPALDGVTGRYFWQRREEEPNPQTEDAAARRRLESSRRRRSGLDALPAVVDHPRVVGVEGPPVGPDPAGVARDRAHVVR